MTGRTCLVCGKELPDGYKIPICKYDRGMIGNRCKTAAGVAAGTIIIASVFLARSGVTRVKEYSPQVVKAIGSVVKKS